jgi:hypothetical protein
MNVYITSLVTLAFLLLPLQVHASEDQPTSTMVGLSKEEVAQRVKKEHKEFRRDASVIKQTFNYLKYVNGIKTKTWIIYFDDEDICRTSKLVCDYGELDQVLEDVRARFGNPVDDIWEVSMGEETLVVELIRQEWYFTIRETFKK